MLTRLHQCSTQCRDSRPPCRIQLTRTYRGKEKHREEPRKGLRQDILDRTRDADLESYEQGKKTATEELDEIDRKGSQFDDVKRLEKKKDDE